MSPITDLNSNEGHSGLDKILDEPEHDGLLRLTRLVEHLFRVPVAYIALLGPGLTVASRIGSGEEHWENLKTYPLAAAFRKPLLWPDPTGALPPGFVQGDLKFAASAPLRSIDGLELGFLIIADVRPRPDFSRQDYDTLLELAGVFAGKMELRTLACQTREVELALQEAERRFGNIANSAPVLIAFGCADGAASFVNRTWLDFTGRTFEDEIGFGFADRFHPNYRETVMQTYWDAFAARVPHTQEFPMRRHDGVYRRMLARGEPRWHDDGVFAGYIACLVDITDQRSALLALQKQTLCTAAVAEASGSFYLILDPQGRIEQVSPRGQRTSRREPEMMCGRFLWEACDAITVPAAAVRDAIKRAASADFTVRVHAGDLLWSFSPVRLPSGELVAIVATAFDPNRHRNSCAEPACTCSQDWVDIDRLAKKE